METMCQRNKQLVAEMDKITDRNGSQRGRQFFDSLMTSPMQRLPRYQLLLKEYQKNSNLLYNDSKVRTRCGFHFVRTWLSVWMTRACVFDRMWPMRYT